MTEELTRGQTLGRYELLLRIGRGGMATVWVARERGIRSEDDRLVAIKAILSELADDPEFGRMFLDEGRLAGSIRHPNVVDVYEVGEEDGVTFMSMEWVEGDSLHTVIAEAGKRKPIPPEMAVRIVADAAAGLHAAHEAKSSDGRALGVVHRDVSPHNILIGTDGSIKLVDFGVAKALGRLNDVTSAGQLKGKFGYMSPEQATARPVDRRSDLFSLGIVLFELTTGRRLFRGEHDAETLHLVVSGQIPKPSQIDPEYPEGLERIVCKALERNPDKRYQTAAELQRDLESYLKEEQIVVARSGVAALLKRVLGARIEQRRRAVRGILRQLDGETAVSGLLSADPAFANVPDARFSYPSDPSFSGSPPSGAVAVHPVELSQPSTSTHATSPQTLSRSMRPRRTSNLSYAIGLGGLAFAVVVVVFYAVSSRRSTTTIVTLPAAPGAERAAPAPQAEQAPKKVEDLPVLGAERGPDAAPPPPYRAYRRPLERPVKESAKKDRAPSPPPVALPRDNPYQ